MKTNKTRNATVLAASVTVLFALIFSALSLTGCPVGPDTDDDGKQAGAAVAAPTLVSKTDTSVTVSATAPTNGQTVEYAKNDSNAAPSSGWQNDGAFNGLTASTTYYFFARSKANDSYKTGAASGGLSVTTNATDTRVELSAGAAVDAAYDATSADVTFTGAGSLTNTDLSAADFNVSGGLSITSVAVNGGTVTVTAGLSTNQYDQSYDYTVSINPNSTAIKGSATVTITQAANPEGETDNRVELTAGAAVTAAYTDTSKSVTFTGAGSLASLANTDFAVTGTGATISSVSVSSGTITVTVNFTANNTASPVTYIVGIAAVSEAIKGNAQVTITQAGVPSAAISGTVTVTATKANAGGSGAVAATSSFVIDLTNVTVNSALSAADVSTWFTPTVTGLTYKATATAGASAITIAIAGTPTAVSTGTAAISIPANTVKDATGAALTTPLSAGSITYNIDEAPASPAKTLTITGLSEYGGYGCEIYLLEESLKIKSLDDLSEDQIEVWGYGDVDQAELTVDLYNDEDEEWTGDGPWYVYVLLYQSRYDNPDIFVSKTTVNFNTANVTKAFSDFKQFAFCITFGELIEEMGAEITIPAGGISLDEVAQGFGAESWAALLAEGGAAPVYKDEALTIEFIGTDKLVATTEIYSKEPLMGGGPGGVKIGEITGTITLTNIPDNVRVYIDVQGNGEQSSWWSWTNQIRDISGTTANNISWSIPVYEENNFIPGLTCEFSLYVESRDNRDSGYRIAIPGSKVINNLDFDVGNLGSVSLASVTLRGTINVTVNGQPVPRMEIQAVIPGVGQQPTVFLGDTRLSSPAAGVAWSLLIPAFETQTEISIIVSGYDTNWIKIFDTWNDQNPPTKQVSNTDVSGITLNLGSIAVVKLSGTITVTYDNKPVPDVFIRAGKPREDGPGYDPLGGTTLDYPGSNAAWYLYVPAFDTQTTVNFYVEGYNEGVQCFNTWNDQNNPPTAQVSNTDVSGITLNLGNKGP